MREVEGAMHFEMWVRDPAPQWGVWKRFPDWSDATATADEKCKKLEPDASAGKARSSSALQSARVAITLLRSLNHIFSDILSLGMLALLMLL